MMFPAEADASFRFCLISETMTRQPFHDRIRKELPTMRPQFRFMLTIWGGSCVRRCANADRLDVDSGDCYDWRGAFSAFLALTLRSKPTAPHKAPDQTGEPRSDPHRMVHVLWMGERNYAICSGSEPVFSHCRFRRIWISAVLHSKRPMFAANSCSACACAARLSGERLFRRGRPPDLDRLALSASRFGIL